MAIKAFFVKNDSGGLSPATSSDSEIMEKYKYGQILTVEVKKSQARSLKQHNMYFAGLLGLAMHYWQPSGGLVSSAESKTIDNFCIWMTSKTGSGDTISEVKNQYVDFLTSSRASKISSPEPTKDSLHRWVKLECGYFVYEKTPSGIIKRPLSVSFSSMSQEDFGLFYKAAFGVVWRFILSRSFESEKEAQIAVDKLMLMG